MCCTAWPWAKRVGFVFFFLPAFSTLADELGLYRFCSCSERYCPDDMRCLFCHLLGFLDFIFLVLFRYWKANSKYIANASAWHKNKSKSEKPDIKLQILELQVLCCDDQRFYRIVNTKNSGESFSIFQPIPSFIVPLQSYYFLWNFTLFAY